MSTPQPVPPPLTIEQRIAALEAKGVAEVKTIWAWIDSKIHYINFAGIVVTIAKLFGKL